MGREELRQYNGMSDRELLMVVIERQAVHKESHDELKRDIKDLQHEIQDLKDTRTEQRGANKFLLWFIGLLGAAGTLLGIKNGL